MKQTGSISNTSKVNLSALQATVLKNTEKEQEKEVSEESSYFPANETTTPISYDDKTTIETALKQLRQGNNEAITKLIASFEEQGKLELVSQCHEELANFNASIN